MYFSSASEFTKRFVEKLDIPAIRIPTRTPEAELLTVDEPFVLICPTYGTTRHEFVPKQVIKFLNNIKNRSLLIGVIGSGNINFMGDFAAAGKIISTKCQVPLLYTFELAGTEDDVHTVKEGLDKFCQPK